MAEFDIVNKVDPQEVDNAVNISIKQLGTRFDFRTSKTEINFNKKDLKLNIVTEDDMKLRAVREILETSMARRGISPKTLRFKDPEPTSKAMIKCEADIIQGIDSDTCRNIVKWIKDMKIKVQAKIMDEQVRVSGKQIDDLQAVIAMLKEKDLPVPLQYVNMKR